MKPLVIANWKMNLDLSDSLILSGSIAKTAENCPNIMISIAPPAIYLYPIREQIKARPKNLSFTIQNIHFEKEGAFTGEISSEMAKKICNYAIIGHSERRQYFAEEDELVNKKLNAALKANMKPIVCVGEQERYHLEDHFNYEVKRMKTGKGILASMDKIFDKIPKKEFENIAIAYEPVWAIGTGNCASAAYASSVCYIIKSHLVEKFGSMAESIRMMYGGSIDKDNVEEFTAQPNIDGLLVGSASLSAKEFREICKITNQNGNK